MSGNALAPVNGGQNFLLEKVREEVLRQVASAIGVVSLAANERVDGIPVHRAKLIERSSALAEAGEPAWITRLQ